ncbi:MerR family DNA-binding transcriptional regulator [Microbacterium sp. ARD32]|uniref:MerR family DNA-binding transcriptional regulator n=1 Tax=Microbacterium sp. ARD32 TaxID=2962577 RepID=UPI0028811201|nr:MerR family DNA-binding transcriptional regulator [Microbacterium sp. ARD32]MDT0156225.1 MerR family DNA-binding transcriptional regulator [Microbacterium sp. ARD32]
MHNSQEHVTTAALARAVGYSTQQVRDLERLGALPAAERASNGYRRYARTHEIALRAYRALAVAIGPVAARSLMPVLRTASLDEAAAQIDQLHRDIAQSRARVRDALNGLDAVSRDAPTVFEDADAMTIGELAGALGVRPSALRHWEDQGLIAPDRDPRSGARRYAADATTAARITAALRSGGFPLPLVARAIELVREHGSGEEARMLLQQRLSQLAERSVALLAASGRLHALLESRDPAGAEADEAPRHAARGRTASPGGTAPRAGTLTDAGPRDTAARTDAETAARRTDAG